MNEFSSRVRRVRDSDADNTAQAGLNLIEGALRIRSGNDGIFGQIERPHTKSAEAVQAWIRSLTSDGENGRTRLSEMREAVVAAAEEVDAATEETKIDGDATSRLRGALFSDALDLLGAGAKPSRTWMSWAPWIAVGVTSGILVGVLLARPKRR